MQISTKGKYSVRAVLDIAQNSHGQPVTLTAISKREGISLLFLEQLFQQLRKGDIVKSIRGPHGGYVLARDAAAITVGEVVRLVEPPLYTSSCFDKNEAVHDCRIVDSCIGGAIWKQLDEYINRFMDSVTFADLINKPKTDVVYHLQMKSNNLLADRVKPNARPSERKVGEVA
ncbi:MAG: Rrf2 family transcriptional regulator [Acidobacteria bacterium]|nr:Rrf2 family transcriptional regulator [Acidobacteriota bacterium]